MREPESINPNEDTRLVPVWSIVIAAAVFVLVEYYFWIVFPKSQHHSVPLGLRAYFNVTWGLLASLYILMVGYISKDAPRRAMSSRFWMLICFVMPGGIGAVLYFLLRAPLVSTCPAIASGPCAQRTSSARAADMNWSATICRRGCAFTQGATSFRFSAAAVHPVCCTAQRQCD